MNQIGMLKIIVRVGYVVEFSSLIVMLMMRMNGKDIPESIAWVFFIGFCVAVFGTLYIIQIKNREKKNRRY